MKSYEIPTVDFRDVDPNIQQERVKLAEEACRTLGYRRLAHAIAIPGALLYELHQLKIDTLWKEKVVAYKAGKIRASLWTSQKIAIAAIPTPVVFFTLFLWMVITPDAALNEYFGHWSVPVCVFAVVSGIGSLVGSIWGICNLKSSSGDRVVTTWDRCSLGRYSSNVPEDAIASAIAIKRVLPEAEFHVEYLVKKSEHNTWPQPDPFLTVSLATTGEEYYLRAWDEEAEYTF